MENTALTIANSSLSVSEPGIREYIAAGFRWRRRILIVFALTALAGITTAFCIPPTYESAMKILVTRERVDPLVAPGQVAAAPPPEVTEENLNSEIELIKNDDVLRKVVLATGLQNSAASLFGIRLFGSARANSDEIRIAKAVQQLANQLRMTLPKKSNIINVSYRSKDGRLSAAVLTALSRFYLEKHLAVHRPPGQFEFFERQAEQARLRLSEAQASINESARKSQAYAPQELDLVVQKLADQRLELQQTYTAISETQRRIAVLEKQLSSTPARITTAIRTAENPELMAQLKATLLQLQLKRTDLLQKFQPKYRTVQEVEQQIAQTQLAIASAESAPVTDRTTERDPTYEWMRSELAKTRTELISLQTRAASIANYTAQYTERARSLSEGNLHQQQLLTKAKALEDSYQLYLTKREEARISDALDQNRILNVSMAQMPNVPVIPTHSVAAIAIEAIFIALLLGVGTGVVSERLDNSFRTPAQVQQYLDIPVIATLPIGELESSDGVRQRRSYEQAL